MMRATSTSIPASSASKSSAATSSATGRRVGGSRLSEEVEKLLPTLIAAKRLVDSAKELLLQALLLADGRLSSFEAIAEARVAAERASWMLQRELDKLSGLDEWVRRVIREALAEAR